MSRPFLSCGSPSIDSNGFLIIPKALTSGTATITVTATDHGNANGDGEDIQSSQPISFTITASAPEPGISLVDTISATRGASDGGYFLLERNAADPSVSARIPYQITGWTDPDGVSIHTGYVNVPANGTAIVPVVIPAGSSISTSGVATLTLLSGGPASGLQISGGTDSMGQPLTDSAGHPMATLPILTDAGDSSGQPLVIGHTDSYDGTMYLDRTEEDLSSPLTVSYDFAGTAGTVTFGAYAGHVTIPAPDLSGYDTGGISMTVYLTLDAGDYSLAGIQSWPFDVEGGGSGGGGGDPPPPPPIPPTLSVVSFQNGDNSGIPGSITLARTGGEGPLLVDYTLWGGFVPDGVSLGPDGYGTFTFPAGQSELILPIADSDDLPGDGDLRVNMYFTPDPANSLTADPNQGNDTSVGASVAIYDTSTAVSLNLTDTSHGLQALDGSYIPLDNDVTNGNLAYQTVQLDDGTTAAILGPTPNDTDRGLQDTVSAGSNGVTAATLTVAEAGSQPVYGTLTWDIPEGVKVWWHGINNEYPRWVPVSASASYSYQAIEGGEQQLADVLPGQTIPGLQLLVQGVTDGTGNIGVTFTPVSKPGTSDTAQSTNPTVNVFSVSVSIAGPTETLDGVVATEIIADDGYDLGLTDAQGNPVADDDPSVTQIPVNANDPYLETATITFSSTVPVSSPYNLTLPAGDRMFDPNTGDLLTVLSGTVPSSRQVTELVQATDDSTTISPAVSPGGGPFSTFNLLAAVNVVGADPAQQPTIEVAQAPTKPIPQSIGVKLKSVDYAPGLTPIATLAGPAYKIAYTFTPAANGKVFWQHFVITITGFNGQDKAVRVTTIESDDLQLIGNSSYVGDEVNLAGKAIQKAVADVMESLGVTQVELNVRATINIYNSVSITKDQGKTKTWDPKTDPDAQVRFVMTANKAFQFQTGKWVDQGLQKYKQTNASPLLNVITKIDPGQSKTLYISTTSYNFNFTSENANWVFNAGELYFNFPDAINKAVGTNMPRSFKGPTNVDLDTLKLK